MARLAQVGHMAQALNCFEERQRKSGTEQTLFAKGDATCEGMAGRHRAEQYSR